MPTSQRTATTPDGRFRASVVGGALSSSHRTHSSIGVLRRWLCPASSSWQGFFDFEVGDGGAGEAGVDVGGPIPGDGLVGSDVVVVLPVGVHVLDEFEGVADLFPEQPLVFHGPEPAFA